VFANLDGIVFVDGKILKRSVYCYIVQTFGIFESVPQQQNIRMLFKIQGTSL